MKLLIQFAALLVFYNIGSAQNKIVVCDSLTKEPVAFVTYKLVAGNAVYLSDANGQVIFESGKTGNYQFDCIGYNSKILVYTPQTDTVFLSPETYELDELIITSNKNNPSFPLGLHKSRTRTMRIPFQNISSPENNNIGKGLFGLFIANTLTGSHYIANLNFKVAKTSKNSRAYIRPYLFSVVNGEVGDELLNENIVVEVDSGSDLLTIDILSKGITLPKEGVYLCFEMLEDTKAIKIGLTKSQSSLSYNLIQKKEDNEYLKISLNTMSTDKEKLNFQIGITAISE